jgi:hypothetical protein
MGKHEDGYERVPRDFYPTPAWVTKALGEYVKFAGQRIWEPAAGRGDMAEVLAAAGADVYSSDIEQRDYKLDRVHDFLLPPPADLKFHGIISNPPYGLRNSLAVKFIELGLERIGDRGFLALLLPIDFDCARGRRHLFQNCQAFAGKIVLTRRIVWFTREQGGEAPKENHCWCIWAKPASGRPPSLMYAPINPELPAVTRPAAEETAGSMPGADRQSQQVA